MWDLTVDDEEAEEAAAEGRLAIAAVAAAVGRERPRSGGGGSGGKEGMVVLDLVDDDDEWGGGEHEGKGKGKGGEDGGVIDLAALDGSKGSSGGGSRGSTPSVVAVEAGTGGGGHRGRKRPRASGGGLGGAEEEKGEGEGISLLNPFGGGGGNSRKRPLTQADLIDPRRDAFGNGIGGDGGAAEGVGKRKRRPASLGRLGDNLFVRLAQVGGKEEEDGGGGGGGGLPAASAAATAAAAAAGSAGVAAAAGAAKAGGGGGKEEEDDGSVRRMAEEFLFGGPRPRAAKVRWMGKWCFMKPDLHFQSNSNPTTHHTTTSRTTHRKKPTGGGGAGHRGGRERGARFHAAGPLRRGCRRGTRFCVSSVCGVSVWEAPSTNHDASTNACLHKKKQVVDQLLTKPDGYPRPKDYDEADMEVEVLESPMVGSSERGMCMYMCMYIRACIIYPGEKLVDRYVLCAYMWCVSACIPLTSPPPPPPPTLPQGGKGSSPYKRGGGGSKTAAAAEAAAGLEMSLEKMQRYIDVLRRADEYKVSWVFWGYEDVWGHLRVCV